MCSILDIIPTNITIPYLKLAHSQIGSYIARHSKWKTMYLLISFYEEILITADSIGAIMMTTYWLVARFSKCSGICSTFKLRVRCLTCYAATGFKVPYTNDCIFHIFFIRKRIFILDPFIILHWETQVIRANARLFCSHIINEMIIFPH